MREIIAAAIFLACVTGYAQVKSETIKAATGKHVVLPNPKLVKCMSSDCYQLWQDQPPTPIDIYPTDVKVSLLGEPCPYGVSARYDKSVSMDDLRAALERRYGKGEAKNWTDAPLMIWEVQSDGLFIQLDTVDKRMAETQKVDVGTKYVHYTELGTHKRCGYKAQ